MEVANEKLLALAHTGRLGQMSYGEIAERIGAKYRSQVQYYMGKLIDEGRLIRRTNGDIVVAPSDALPSLVSLPVYGSANCGPATLYANGEITEVIHVSPSLLRKRLRRGVFAVRAVGDSMNAANIVGKTLEDGDYAVIEPMSWRDTLDGDYILSVIDGLGNIKRVSIDAMNHRIILRSESTEFREDIVVDGHDLDLYSIAGRVVDVVKRIDR